MAILGSKKRQPLKAKVKPYVFSSSRTLRCGTLSYLQGEKNYGDIHFETRIEREKHLRTLNKYIMSLLSSYSLRHQVHPYVTLFYVYSMSFRKIQHH